MSKKAETIWNPRLNRSYGAECASDYAANLTIADTLDRLRELVENYKRLAKDAIPVVAGMTADDFSAFRDGLKEERRGRFAGDAWCERFGAVLMPQPMMNVSIVADQFKVPFGVAWIRCQEHRPDLLKVKVPRAEGRPQPPSETPQ